MKTLVIVSGGDAPGINMTIARFVALAAASGDVVVGAMRGIPSLINNQIEELTTRKLTPLMGVSGTYLATSREPILANDEGRQQFQAAIARHEIDNILLFGGDGSLRYIPPIFAEMRVPFVGIPTTIDNNIPYTELTLGFDSACNFAYQSIDGILATGSALADRLFLLETLGGDSGVLALHVAQGAAAHAVLLPEYDYDLSWLVGRVKWAMSIYGFALIVICEGAKGARTLADTADLGYRVRDTRLGHAQRGAKPSHQDRVLAVSMAEMAYQALRAGDSHGVLVTQGGKLGLLKSVPETTECVMPDKALYCAINGL